jgi:ATP synthase protein I
MSNITFRLLIRFWLQQAGLLLLVSTAIWWTNHVIAYSVLIGGLIYIIPTMYFALYAFRFRGAQAAQMMLMSFYRGEIGKFLLSCVGFAISFTLVKPLDVLALFCAYTVLTIIQWIQLARIR